MVLLDNDTFLTKLTILFHEARNTGSIGITMKRYDGRTKHLPKNGSKNPEPSEYMCLLRASLANRKISTIVHPKEVNRFQQAYCSLLRGNMDGLKKVKKSKQKTKATQ
ncbi:signal recognition particle 14 kDa protein [Cimex lectularius]|uniref:Signal recognition particle 14 kDa protein n=1 Tax=Cimex lectularius TaxID=79782 RepID=A0A8I6RV42_CIMLE|nr:signal recognition particle 14 kDa protein [Cimex lectularius]